METETPAAPDTGTVRRDFLKSAALVGLGATGAGALLAGPAGATMKPGHAKSLSLAW